MKTNRILLLSATLLLLPWCLAPLFSQQESNKKVVITKRTVDADGSESTETIIKKGAAAEKFDVDKYIKENRADNTTVQIDVSGGDDERSIVVKGPITTGERKQSDKKPDKSQSPFLGVDEDSDEKADQPGLVVNVVRGSAADQAGLHDNDKILQLNGVAIDRWSDLSKFMRSAKVGDQVAIVYERYGKTYNTRATLTGRNEVKVVQVIEKGFLGISNEDNEGDNDAPGLEVSVTKGSAAEKAGLMNGDIIFQLNEAPISDFEDVSDFMAYTKPGDKVTIVYERNGKRNTTEALLTESTNSWNVDLGNWDFGNNIQKSLDDLREELGQKKGNATVNVRTKEACLGVYSDLDTQVGLNGSRVDGFTDDSGAREAGLQNGDIITAVNGKTVKNHDELWQAISAYKGGDVVSVEFLRNGKAMKVDATLKACQDKSSRVQIFDGDGGQVRDFTSWNWSEKDQKNLRERSIITIRRGQGDAPKVNASPGGDKAETAEQSLKLYSFRAYPNPTMGQVTVEFSAEPVATTVSFFDLAGRQLFREELNAFGGRYYQQFDLSDYSKDKIVIQVQQGERVHSEQLQVN